jgi:hypothetical protein
VRTHGHVSDAAGRSSGQRRGEKQAPRGESFTGELLSASDDEVTLAVADGVVAIPYSEIRRSNLVEA